MPPDLIPVDHDPFNELPMSLEPVEHDPFGTAPQGNVAGSLAGIVGGLGQRAADWYQRQPSWSDRMAAAQAGTDPTRLSGGIDPTAQLDALGGLVGSTTPKAGIKAYHGSPYDFEAFDSSKIGTGEGAQAYGHGLYFAEQEGTAKQYRDTLGRADKISIGGKPLDPSQTTFQDQQAANWLKTVARDRAPTGELIDQAIDRATKYVSYMEDRGATQSAISARATIEKLKGWKEAGVDIANPGKMYEVNIAADPEHFLDWDNPLSEQPHVMQNAPQLLEAAKQEAYNRALAATSKSRADELWAMVKDPSRAPGEFAHQAFEKNAARESYAIADPNGLLRHWPSTATTKAEAIAEAGGDASRVKVIRNPDKSVASSTLRDAGIPGIKYLDQGSRGAGAGTHNYVVFNDRLIDIARKYGLAGLIAGGVHHFSTTPVDRDPYAQ